MIDKRRLRNIVRPTAKEEYFSQARIFPELQYLAELKQFDDILQITFFPTKALIKGREGADARIFVSADDYITQDLKTAKTKWIKGRVDYATHFEWNYQKPWLGNIGFVDEESRQLFVNRFGDTNTNRYTNPWPNFYNWQTKVLERKRRERYDRELEETYEYMSMIGDLPADFYDWMRTAGINQAAYLIYDAESKKKEKLVFCTVCQKYHIVDTGKMVLRNYETGRCPGCGAEAEYRSRGRVSKRFHKDCWLCVMQPVPGGYAARYLSAHFHYDFSFYKETNIYAWKMTMSHFELCRDFYIGKVFKSFEYRVYKQLTERWCPSEWLIPNDKAIVYTRNLKDVFIDTQYRYCALDIYQERSGYRSIPVFNYMKKYPEAPCLEYFIKSGLIRLTTDIVNYGKVKYVNLKSEDKRRIICLPSPYIRQLIRLDGNQTTLNLLCDLALKDHIHPPKDDFVIEWQKTFGHGDSHMAAADNAGIPLPKFMRYIQKQKKKYNAAELERCGHYHYGRPSDRHEKYRRDCTNIATDWEDYIGFCRQLRINLNDEYNLLPPDLKQAHDRLAGEVQKIKNERERKEKERQEREVNRILSNMQTDNPYKLNYKGIFIMIPANTDAIKREGETLHHCVATYIKRVAKGETMILFVRQEKSPDEPFYTLEYRDGKVIQCRGKRNCDMTEKVKTFVGMFEKMMQEKEARERIRVRVS